jgi:hypothetical protein
MQSVPDALPDVGATIAEVPVGDELATTLSAGRRDAVVRTSPLC